MNRRALLIALAVILPLAAVLYAPPELVLPSGERIPYPTLLKDRFTRAEFSEVSRPGRNLFLIEPPAKTPMKPPEPIKVKVITPEEKADLDARRLEATRRVSGRFTLIGYHTGKGILPDRAFLAEEGTIHILLTGSTLHDRYCLESIGTSSVMLRDLTADRLEEVRFRK